MDAAAFEQVYQAFGEFHSLFGPLFGRSESREHSLHYLQALLVQSGSGATPKTSRNRWASRPGRCSASSAKLPGTMTR